MKTNRATTRKMAISVETLEGRKLLSHFALHHERFIVTFIPVQSGGPVHLNLMTHGAVRVFPQVMVRPLAHR